MIVGHVTWLFRKMHVAIMEEVRQRVCKRQLYGPPRIAAVAEHLDTLLQHVCKLHDFPAAEMPSADTYR